MLGLGPASPAAQDILSEQLRQGFGKNKVRYKHFDWWILQGEHLDVLYEPQFDGLADLAVRYLDEAYDHISQVLTHELSTRPPVVIFPSHYQFQQTNIIHDFLPPGVAGFAEPLRYRMVIPFNGDLDEFRNVLAHELTHIFQYDILYQGPLKTPAAELSAPPTWIMEGLAEYATQEKNTIDEMVLRDAVLTNRLIPLEVMNSAWGASNVFLAYKQSHSLIEYIADNYGPQKVSHLLPAWELRNDTDILLKHLVDADMKTLHQRWAAHLRKKYWPLLQSRDYLAEIGRKVVQEEGNYAAYSSPRWSLSGDLLAALSSDGVEQHLDIIRVHDGSLVERVTRHMRTVDYDHLTSGSGTVAWAPDGHTIAFVAKKGPEDIILLWDLYHQELIRTLRFDQLEIIESLAFDPSSRRLAFAGTGYAQSDIYLVDIATGKLQQLTATPQRDEHPAWSPDGKRLAFSTKHNHQFDIKIYELEGGQTRVLMQSPTDDLWPSWFPAGDKLLFVSTREHINDLFVYDLEEEREYRLTRTLSGIMGPALSPDGRQIVMSTYYQGRSQLYLLDLPAWPELKKRSAELIARATGPSPSARGAQVPAVAPDRTALLAQRAGPRLDQKPRAAQPKVLYQVAESPVRDETELDPEEAQSSAPFLAEQTAAADTASLSRRPYTATLEPDGFSLQMGYYDGFFSTIGQLGMSDLMGNHSLALATNAVASQEIDSDFNFATTYTYYGRRPRYNVALFNWNQFYNDDSLYLTGGGLARGVVRSRQNGILLDVSYPRDIYRRIDLSYAYVREHEKQIWPEQADLGAVSTHLLKASYVHDSINYGLLGPTAGRRYFLSVGRTLEPSEANRSFSHLELDYRHYLRLGRWSVLGLRAAGVGSLGRDGLEYYLGGPTWFLPFYTGFNLNTGPLRGYRFSEFSGSRVVLMNAEVRVPFVRRIVFGWPATFAIPAVDGSLFMDVGGTWNGGEDLALWPLHNPHEPPEGEGDRRHLRAGIGFGLLVYFLLPINLEFAKQTDLQGNYSDYQWHFSFGRSF